MFLVNEGDPTLKRNRYLSKSEQSKFVKHGRQLVSPKFVSDSNVYNEVKYEEM